MARLTDEIVVVDVESTCWEGEPPEGQQSEIIEIGVSLLPVGSLQVAEPKSIFVNPVLSQVSPFCTELTGITPEMVAGGLSFPNACKLLRSDFKTKDRLWASWGDYDRRQFERQCHFYEINSPFGPSHLNIKALFARALALPSEVGMAEALEILKLPLVGRHHSGADDARNIAHILSVLLARLREED